MFEILGVSKSGYYDWLTRKPSNRSLQKAKVKEAIKAIYDESKCIYGAPKITKELHKRGFTTAESTVTLQMAQILKEKLLAQGYDVLIVRNSDDVQLDNVARTVLCNNVADCHISLHWDGDGLGYDKGCFYISVPDGLKSMEPVASHWQEHDALGASLVEGLRTEGMTIYQNGSMNIDLTQTSYSTIPSVDMELGNASSDHSDSTLNSLADGLVLGLNAYFGN